jgi:hypothetical protein
MGVPQYASSGQTHQTPGTGDWLPESCHATEFGSRYLVTRPGSEAARILDPSPRMEREAEPEIIGIASSRTSAPFSRLSLPTHPTTNSSSGIPRTRRASARSNAGAEPPHPLGIRWIRSSGNPLSGEAGHQGTRHRNHGVEPPEGPRLQPFIQPVLPVAAGEPMHGGYGLQALAPRGAAGDQVRSISMGVHDVRRGPSQHLGDLTQLP